MIISHKYKFIFVAVPKTGTHTVRHLLRPFLDAQTDEEQYSLYGHRKKSSYKQLNIVRHGHLTALQIKQAVGDDVWKSYFKFALVRNPYDRFLSAYFFMGGDHLSFKFQPFYGENQDELALLPQTHYVCDEEGNVMVDYLGCTETFDKSMQFIFKKLNLTMPDKYSVENATPRKKGLQPDESYFQFIKDTYPKDIITYEKARENALKE